MVVPGVMGLCLYSPPVNKSGNSVRGLHFCKVPIAIWEDSIFSFLQLGHVGILVSVLIINLIAFKN